MAFQLGLEWQFHLFFPCHVAVCTNSWTPSGPDHVLCPREAVADIRDTVLFMHKKERAGTV
jgi:hypothetical protein